MKFYKSFFVALSFIAAGTACADELPQFTPFNWAELSSGYIVKGKACTHVEGLGNLGCYPATVVVDAPNNRMFIDLGRFGGQYYIYKDSAYANESKTGAGCLKVPNFNYNSQINGWSTILSTPGSTTTKANYIGFAKDVGSCTERLAASFTVQNGVLSEANYSQLFPVRGRMAIVTQMLTFDPNTIDTTSDRAAYFSMPSTCNSSAANYCEVIYPNSIK
jgi:hypothetical protein